MISLQTQLEQSRLRETELLGALKEMQDKVLDLEKVCGRGESRDQRVRRVQCLQPLQLNKCPFKILVKRFFVFHESIFV